MSGAHGYRIFNVILKEKIAITPSLVRCVFSGDEVDKMKLESPDQRIKVLLPGDNGQTPNLQNGEGWYQTMLKLPKDERPIMRTYTLRGLRAAQKEADVEFVVHGETGPASSWVIHAQPGAALQLVAPNAECTEVSGGFEWAPPVDVQQVLLIADETALPAAVGILEQLASQPQPPAVQAFFEVPLQADCQDLSAFPFVQVHWLPREQGHHGVGEALLAAVSAHVQIPASACASDQSLALQSLDTTLLWERAESEATSFYAWVAAESSAVKALRRHLIGERELDRSVVNFMAYWCR